jgi:hypothetical protein
MPSLQRGELIKNAGGSWSFRYYDADGRRRIRGTFAARKEAAEVLERTLEDVRLGPRQRRELTLSELVDQYVEQHIAEANSIATLTARLKHATAAFGNRRLDRLHVGELSAWRKRLPEGSAWHT